jgi:SAM-dependent methyltransferase
LSVFARYAGYYDLLYRDKDYLGEVDFVSSLLSQHVPGCRTICDLGCGTGKHAVLLAEMGYAVHGIDLSVEMLEIAQARVASLPAGSPGRLRFSAGDVRTCRLGSTFDAALALFHVVSYQATNEDLIGMFKNAAVHLREGGVFICDYWYGPAVLSETPTVRIKHMESDEIAVVRVAEPVLNVDRSMVDVSYRISVRDKATGATDELRETHQMRYLFDTDMEGLARLSGLRLLDSFQWLTRKKPGSDTWSVCSIFAK